MRESSINPCFDNISYQFIVPLWDPRYILLFQEPAFKSDKALHLIFEFNFFFLNINDWFFTFEYNIGPLLYISQ